MNIIGKLGPGLVFGTVGVFCCLVCTASVVAVGVVTGCAAGEPPCTYTDTLLVIHGLAGADIDVTRTDEDILAKQYFVSVWATPAGQSAPRTLLIQYEPEVDEVPSIIENARGDIVVLIRCASSVACQSHTWNGRRLRYAIGSISYASDPPPCPIR